MGILPRDEAQVLIEKTRRMTQAQASYIRDLIESRIPADDEQALAYWRQRWNQITCNVARPGQPRETSVSAMIEDLKVLPTQELLRRRAEEEDARRRAAEQQARRHTSEREDGYYRNPETGELWRVSHSKTGLHEVILSKYSTTGGPRRLLTSTDQVVKGSWKRLNAWDTRRTVRSIDPAWKIDPKTLAQDYAYGFCPLHHGPLTDAVSVVLGYGPDCAEKEGLPWGEEAMHAVLDARKAALKTDPSQPMGSE
jgi:hypothetical protein